MGKTSIIFKAALIIAQLGGDVKVLSEKAHLLYGLMDLSIRDFTNRRLIIKVGYDMIKYKIRLCGGWGKMKIIAHTMEYQGGYIASPLRLRNYSVLDYTEYKRVYNECFRDMRTALQRFPVDCCGSKEELERKKEKIYVLDIDGKLIGSVAIYDNEIDDLIVEKSYQRMGYGEVLLQFAVSYMQSNNISPIVLHVADWNQGAIKMYMKNGFTIVKTEEV